MPAAAIPVISHKANEKDRGFLQVFEPRVVAFPKAIDCRVNARIAGARNLGSSTVLAAHVT